MTHPLHHDSTTTSGSTEGPVGTALVLGGGGSAGNAWLIGILAGLYDAGLDVADADLTVGTSAGSTAAAQLVESSPPDLFAATVEAAPPPAGTAASGRAGTGPGITTNHLERLSAIIAASSGAADYRRRVAAVLDADAASSGSASERWRAIVAARFPARSWPQRRRLLITAVDARTGEPVIFDRDGRVELVDAVAASCAGGFAYAVGDDRYIDGGYRSNADNADLAAGCARALVLSPLGGRALTPAEWGTHLVTQVDALRAAGSRVEKVFPDPASRAAFGDNMMDASTRAPAARAGYEQGRAIAGRLAEFWR